MALATMPFVRVSSLFLPAAVSILFAILLYVFVMPRLASFVGLGVLLFAVTFAIGWLFHTPRQGVGRTFGLVMFLTIASITNEQTYNFLSAATTALMFLLVLALLAVTAHIPYSARPEKVFLRLLGRLFRSAEYLMGTMRWGAIIVRPGWSVGVGPFTGVRSLRHPPGWPSGHASSTPVSCRARSRGAWRRWLATCNPSPTASRR